MSQRSDAGRQGSVDRLQIVREHLEIGGDDEGAFPPDLRLAMRQDELLDAFADARILGREAVADECRDRAAERSVRRAEMRQWQVVPICGMFESEDALIDAYQAQGGLPIDREVLHWHKLFCTWKQLALSLGSALRASDAQTHQDVLLSWLSCCGYTLCESLLRQLEARG